MIVGLVAGFVAGPVVGTSAAITTGRVVAGLNAPAGKYFEQSDLLIDADNCASKFLLFEGIEETYYRHAPLQDE